MLNALWLTFKFLLSLILVLVAIVIFFGSAHKETNIASLLLISSIFLVLAAIPWLASVDAMRKNGRAAWMLGTLFGIGFAAMAREEFQGLAQHPSVCSGRSALMCHLINWLYEAGGGIAVGTFYALISMAIFFCAIAVFVKHANQT